MSLVNYVTVTAVTLLIKIICLLVTIAYYTLAERKIMASVQRRLGPNVVGFWGLLQPVADGLKLFAKEFVIPARANSRIFIFAPISVLLCAFLAWAVIPFRLFDHSTGMSTKLVRKCLINIDEPTEKVFSQDDFIDEYVSGLKDMWVKVLTGNSTLNEENQDVDALADQLVAIQEDHFRFEMQMAQKNFKLAQSQIQTQLSFLPYLTAGEQLEKRRNYHKPMAKQYKVLLVGMAGFPTQSVQAQMEGHEKWAAYWAEFIIKLNVDPVREGELRQREIDNAMERYWENCRMELLAADYTEYYRPRTRQEIALEKRADRKANWEPLHGITWEAWEPRLSRRWHTHIRRKKPKPPWW